MINVLTDRVWFIRYANNGNYALSRERISYRENGEVQLYTLKEAKAKIDELKPLSPSVEFFLDLDIED